MVSPIADIPFPFPFPQPPLLKPTTLARNLSNNKKYYSQTRSSVPIANELMNSFTEK